MTTTLAALISNITTILTSVLTWIVSVFESMIASPVILLFLGFAVVGTIIAFAKKILM